jgi:hypothetical protein
MGYMRHHAIVVSSWNEESIARAHGEASSIFKWVSPVSPPMMNGHRSFFIPPDGSKENWPESEEGDRERARFVLWLDKQRCKDGSTNLKWVEVQFADDEQETKILSHSDEKGPR